MIFENQQQQLANFHLRVVDGWNGYVDQNELKIDKNHYNIYSPLTFN
jgi:hypothetical protein